MTPTPIGPRARAASWLRLVLPLVLLPAPRPAPAASEAEQVAAGDSAYARGALADAHARYLGALQDQPGAFAVLWRLARVESEMGEDARGEEQRHLIADAVARARSAIKAAPDSALGHVWLAVALGRQALREGPKTRLALSREIKAEADRAIQIDPTIGRAWHVRAAWNRKLATLNSFERMAAGALLGGVPKGASLENAVRDFEKAIGLEPDYVNHRLELGRTFADMKRWADARRELEKAVSLPPTSNPRDPHYQREARDLLSRLPKD